MYIINFLMFNNIYVIHIYNIKLAFFAPRFKILGGFFVYFSVLNLSPKLQNNYYEIWFTVMMCHQPSLIYNYLYKILVTFQLPTLQNCCWGGVCVCILTWSIQKIFWSCLMFCLCVASVTLKIAFTRQSWTYKCNYFTVFCKCKCKGFTTYMYKTLSGFFYVCFSITNTAFKRYV